MFPTKCKSDMKNLKLIFGIGLIILAAYSIASQALSDTRVSSKSNRTASDMLQSYVWYDGQQKRTVWLNRSLVAEFRHGASENRIMQKRYPAAGLWKNYHTVRIWKFETQPFPDALSMRRESSTQTQSRYSPVFHDVPTNLGSMRSLPGNVIVYLNPGWDQDIIMHWVKRSNYEVVKKLSVRPNAFVLKTEPGIETLQLANALYESGEVVAAFPDWWLQATMR